MPDLMINRLRLWLFFFLLFRLGDLVTCIVLAVVMRFAKRAEEWCQVVLLEVYKTVVEPLVAALLKDQSTGIQPGKHKTMMIMTEVVAQVRA